MKVIINQCWGGFGLSEKAKKMLKIKYDWDVKRNDPKLVKVVEELGKEANGQFANLKIIEIPDDIEWDIEDYDGMESIHEKHRIWG